MTIVLLMCIIVIEISNIEKGSVLMETMTNERLTMEEILVLKKAKVATKEKYDKEILTELENLESNVYCIKDNKIAYQPEFLAKIKKFASTIGNKKIQKEISSLENKFFDIEIDIRYTQKYNEKTRNFDVISYIGNIKTNLPTFSKYNDVDEGILSHEITTYFEISDELNGDSKKSFKQKITNQFEKRITIPLNNLTQAYYTLSTDVQKYARERNIDVELIITSLRFETKINNLYVDFCFKNTTAEKENQANLFELSCTERNAQIYFGEKCTSNDIDVTILKYIDKYPYRTSNLEYDRTATAIKLGKLVLEKATNENMDFDVRTLVDNYNSEQNNFTLSARITLIMSNTILVNVNLDSKSEIDYEVVMWKTSKESKVFTKGFKERYRSNITSIEQAVDEIISIAQKVNVLFCDVE